MLPFSLVHLLGNGKGISRIWCFSGPGFSLVLLCVCVFFFKMWAFCFTLLVFYLLCRNWHISKAALCVLIPARPLVSTRWWEEKKSIVWLHTPIMLCFLLYYTLCMQKKCTSIHLSTHFQHRHHYSAFYQLHTCIVPYTSTAASCSRLLCAQMGRMWISFYRPNASASFSGCANSGTSGSHQICDICVLLDGCPRYLKLSLPGKYTWKGRFLNPAGTVACARLSNVEKMVIARYKADRMCAIASKTMRACAITPS